MVGRGFLSRSLFTRLIPPYIYWSEEDAPHLNHGNHHNHMNHSSDNSPLFTLHCFFETRGLGGSFLVSVAEYMSRARGCRTRPEKGKKTLDKIPDSLYYMLKLWSSCVTTVPTDHGFIII